MILNEFIQGSSDENLLKSLPTEGISEDLIKAMNKAGLVQKEVQVRGKNGQTFTRKQWVKASDAQTQTAQPKQSSASGITEDDIKKEFKKTSVAVKDKWGDTIDTHTGYAGKNGSLCSIEKKGDKWVVNLGDTSRGFVAQTSKDTKEEAYALMYKNLGGTKKTVNSGDKSSKDKIKPGDSLTINGKSVEVLKVNDKGYTVKNAEGIVSQVSKKAVNDEIAMNGKSPSKDYSKTTSEKESGTIEGEAHNMMVGYLKSRGINPKDGAAVKNAAKEMADQYTNKANKKSAHPNDRAHNQKLADAFNKIAGSQSSSDKNKQSDESSNQNTAILVDGGSITHYPNGVTPTFHGGKSYKYSAHVNGSTGADKYFNTEAEAKAYIKNQTKTASNNNAKTSKSSMIEDYFAGDHSHEDGKKALAMLLGKGYTRQDIMSQAETSGITWKKNDHEGINWMRASMAIQKAWKKG